ncbi:MAG: lamin tail domain-containing protein, partial [Planctomycetes bacterium]|nr:lamin tail domain-containing protein [Planctomycetota bacterium]
MAHQSVTHKMTIGLRKTDILLWLCVAAVLSTRAQGVQINELMASNRETLQDNAGDYEDWIELHNPASAPVDVGGWFLSDDLGQPQKWQIPRDSASLTTIAGGGFLVIWADNQPEQGILHARFRLSAGGEA